ncbi:MAG: hypothetical protein U9Q83_02660 [Bacteroidota bacterium]|nr:hypothetical protein [Bacteroidota bacterium]
MKYTTEFKIQIENELVKMYGKEKIESFLEKYLNLAIIKLSKQELLDDLQTIDINDNKWQTARQNAWNEYGSKLFLKVSS